jgi:hypothetical protein
LFAAGGKVAFASEWIPALLSKQPAGQKDMRDGAIATRIRVAWCREALEEGRTQFGDGERWAWKLKVTSPWDGEA